MREKRIRGQDKSAPLFDYRLDTFNPDEPFALEFSEIPSSLISAYVSAAKRQATSFARTTKLLRAAETETVTPQPISVDDPLNPDLFIGHHRRMEREERRMQLLERQQLMIAASKVKQQKEALERNDWKGHIEKIVRINNINDAEEVNCKRKLAIQEMTLFLEKFEENNRRTNRRDSKIEAKLGVRDKKKKTQPKRPPKAAAKPRPLLPGYDDFKEPQKPSISIRPVAFGGMLPPRQFPPTEYCLPRLLILETNSYDLVERLRKQRQKLNLEEI